MASDLEADEFRLHLFPNNFDGATNTYGSNFLIMNGNTLDGINLFSLVESGEFQIDDGDQILIFNDDNTKVISFTATGIATLGMDRLRVSFYGETLAYNGPPGVGFNDDENIDITSIFIMFFFFRKTIDRFIFKLLSLPSLSQKNISEYVLKFPVFYEQ